MASRTITYFVLLLMWFIIAAFSGFNGVSKASDLLAKVQSNSDLHSFLNGVAEKNENAKFSFNWSELNKWAENLQ